MKYGLIGEKLSHSFSATVHKKIGDYSYELCEIAPDDLDEFMRKRDFLGINVTIPYKQAVIPYLDEIDNAAKLIGAVNTIINRGGRLYGYNTDYYGLKALLAHSGIDPLGKKTAVLGTGATSKTASAVLRFTGADMILRIGRRSRVGNIDYQHFVENHSDTELIINTTPCGMYPDIFSSVIDLSSFTKLKGVCDVIYNPINTTLVKQARALGAKAEGGTYMLVAQAVYASELFFNTKYPDDLIERIYNDIIKEKENIVLIGMPSCGKTTVAEILSSKLSKEIIDTDRVITERIGMSIKDYFSLYGEEEFRRIESEVIKEISSKNSVIISTGGGAVLQKENISALKYNGKIVFIDRPIKDLIPTESRPLSKSTEDIEAMYKVRYDIYSSACDIKIHADCSAKEVADKILESLK